MGVEGNNVGTTKLILLASKYGLGTESFHQWQGIMRLLEQYMNCLTFLGRSGEKY